MLFDVKIFSQCLHVKILKQFFYTLIKNRDVDKNCLKYFEQAWYFCDEKSIIARSKLKASSKNAAEKIFVIIFLKIFNATNLNRFLNHCNAESRKHWKKIFMMLFSLYVIEISIKCCKKLALLIEMRSFDKFIIIIKSKKFIFLTQIWNLIFSMTAITINVIKSFFTYDIRENINSKYNFIEIERNEIDREKINFELFEVNMNVELATKITFDLMINLKYDLIDVDLLKLIVNFSNLNDSTNLIFDSKLTTISIMTIFYFIFFWTMIVIFFVLIFSIFAINMKIEFVIKKRCD